MKNNEKNSKISTTGSRDYRHLGIGNEIVDALPCDINLDGTQTFHFFFESHGDPYLGNIIFYLVNHRIRLKGVDVGNFKLNFLTVDT